LSPAGFRAFLKIKNLEEWRDKINAVLAHKERHLDELHDKLRDAQGDDFRSIVFG